MLLAAKALAEEVKATTLSVDGKPVSGPVLRGLTPAELKDGALTITNNGDTAVDAVVSVIGAALTPEPAISKGFTDRAQATTRSTARRWISRAPPAAKRAQAERPLRHDGQGHVG